MSNLVGSVRWSKEETQRIINILENNPDYKNWPIEATKKRFPGRTMKAIHAKAYRESLKLSEQAKEAAWPREDKELAWQMYLDEKSFSEIAEAIDKPLAVVERVLNKGRQATADKIIEKYDLPVTTLSLYAIKATFKYEKLENPTQFQTAAFKQALRNG